MAELYSFLQKNEVIHSSDERVALVIGNDEYKHVPLNSCENDATRIAETLKKLRFDTSGTYLSIDKKTMINKIDNFIKGLKPNNIIFVYFSGHGCSNKSNKTFLLPIDYEGNDVLFDDDYLCANKIISDIESKLTDGVCIAIFDACRIVVDKNNEQKKLPLPVGIKIGMSRIDVKGVISAYSCEEGTVSYFDDVGLYTDCLLANIYKPKEIANILELANEELAIHRNNRHSRPQRSEYVDNRNKYRELILNDHIPFSTATKIECKLERDHVCCRPRPSADTIWASKLQNADREYRMLRLHGIIKIVKNDCNWGIKVSDNDIIITRKHKVILENGSSYFVNEGTAYPLVTDKVITNDKKCWIVIKGTSGDGKIIVDVAMAEKKYTEKLRGYWVKVEATITQSEKFTGYVHSSLIPPYIAQSILP